MHVTGPSIAQRYLDRGFELERVPLASPFEFLAVGDPDGERAPRLAVFSHEGRVGASRLVDVRLVARDLGARAVFWASEFTEDAHRIADRFGIELREQRVPGEPDGPPAAAPPVASDDVPPPFVELATPPVAHVPLEVSVPPVDPILAVEARAHPDFAEFEEFPTPAELRDELRHLNTLLDRPSPHEAPELSLEEFEEPRQLAETVIHPAILPGAVPELARLTEAAIALDPADGIDGDELADLAAWYDDLCALEARHADDAELARWREEVIDLEARALAEEVAGRHRVAVEALFPLAQAAGLLRAPVEFAPRPAGAAAFREVEEAIPATAGAVLVWPGFDELAPLAHAGGVLHAEPEFSPAGGAGVAFRAVEDAAPALPDVAFTVALEAPVEAAPIAIAEEEPLLAGAPPDLGTLPILPPRQVLPWVPAPLPPHASHEARLFLDAFNRAQQWRTLQALEATRQEARESVRAATDVPKPEGAKTQPHEDYELL
ncbi:MAG TPA: hypothetical protein VI997_11255 [Candidatus Thermoplasmatota archaeon]|nr:hypothetical protein [Candidatus Thermoplasmatota archaeon]